MAEVHQDGASLNSAESVWLPRDAVVAALNPHLRDILKFESQHEAKVQPPFALLSPLRLDVMAKYIYAQGRMFEGQRAWATHVYREHLRVWNDFKEGDLSAKNSFEDYKQSFDLVLNTFSSRGFDEARGLLPIGSGQVIIDGAHRLAAALLSGCAVQTVQFGMRPKTYDYRFFQERGLSDAILDDMALQYCRLDRRVRVAVVFPVARGQDEKILSLLQQWGGVVCAKAISFSSHGRSNLIRLLYRNEPWLGDGIRPTEGLLHHVNNRFADLEPVKFVFFIGGDDNDNRKLKDQVRSMFSLGNDSIHINDTHAQTVSIGESILNANSVHFLNHARARSLKTFSVLFKEAKQWISREALEVQRFCVDGSSVMAAYGIRDVNDIDYLYLGEPPQSSSDLISCHNSEMHHYAVRLDDLVLDPRHHFYCDGIKFVALHRLSEMKARRGEPKDVADVHRIKALEGETGLLARLSKSYYILPERLHSARYQTLRLAKRAVPPSLQPLARTIYKLPGRVRDLVGPDKKTFMYRGFEFRYSKGTSLLECIQGGRVYEPEVSRQVLRALKRCERPTFLDIGANLGLMTLNVLAENPTTQVIAFEPGPHQAGLLEETIAINRLADRVSIIRCALSHQPGSARFAVHRTRHASGDGFFDTRRAGRTTLIEVPVTTLDYWWQSAGAPFVDVIKIDTEGAELWVLQGGAALINSCRPVVIFELHPQNIAVYPYEAVDILRWFDDHGYKIKTVRGEDVTERTLDRQVESGNDYVAAYAQ